MFNPDTPVPPENDPSWDEDIDDIIASGAKESRAVLDALPTEGAARPDLHFFMESDFSGDFGMVIRSAHKGGLSSEGLNFRYWKEDLNSLVVEAMLGNCPWGRGRNGE